MVPVLRMMTALGLQPVLAYPAVIKLRHGGEQRSFDSLRKAEDFISSLSQKKAFAAAPQGNGKAAAAFSSAQREGLDGRDREDASCLEEDGGGRQGRKFRLTVGGGNIHKISQEQFLKGTQIIQLNCSCKDVYTEEATTISVAGRLLII